ncbi:uncharacterized protein TRIADDRAFT_12520, partial [Trichoplax adhaerens]
SLTSRPVLRSVEPIGKWFESYWRGSDKNQTYNAIGDPYRVPAEESSAESTSLCIEDEISEDYLASLDPREWKSQDHYSILGLKSLRFRASEEQIKRCYKQTVLKYHPDKSTREVGRNNIEITEAIFTCITKAYEILGHSQKRKAYDSIDPTFDDSIPPPCVNSKENFFKSFTPCFESNARFSIIQPVPSLGDENTSFKDVETFYNFWYNFESWREFSYQDEEDLSKAENREERRWMEKQNKVARQKKKKEDSGRIRQLVDNAYSCDPRIKKFKEEQKERKAALKKAKIEAARALQEENERIRRMKLDEERKRNEILQKEEKEKADKIKREREELKKMLKKERKTLRTICKRHNYFANSDEERLKGMEEVESLCNNLTLDQLKSLNSDMSAGNAETIGVIFRNHIEEVLKKLREIQLRDELPVSQDQTTKGENSSNRSSRSWNDEEEQLLVKAVKVFPPGTVDRWDCIASFLKVHGSDHINRTSKEVIAKVKAMQNEGFETRKQKANEDAFSSFSKSQFKDVDANSDSSSVSHEKNNVEEPWTANEQKLLEKALKTYPSSVPERWDRIAAAIPGRTKKECLKRYKELAALVKAKRA